MAQINNYPSDFEAGSPVPFDSAEPQLFLGVEPLLLLLLVLIGLILFAAGGWMAHARMGRTRANEPDIIPAIHKRLRSVLEKALTASSHELPARAQDVEAEFQRLLGPVLKVGTMRGALGDLRKALNGDAPPAQKSGAAPAREPRSGCHCGQPARGGDCTCSGSGPTVLMINPTVVTQVPICTCGGPAAGLACTCNPAVRALPARNEPPAESHASAKPDKPSKMAYDQQARALREALQALYDHWSVDADRISELQAAHTALSTRPPKPAAHAGVNAHASH